MDYSDDQSSLLLENPLLQNGVSDELPTGDCSVDAKGKRAVKQNTGNWKACCFIIGAECCESLAFFGISSNLVTYLTKELHQANVDAAKTVSIWQGTTFLTPLIGAIVADAYLGKYWTIVVSSIIYFIGLCALTLSASITPALGPDKCEGPWCLSSANAFQSATFLCGLYLVALGTGGIKPCVSPFGGDQFDDTDPKERAKKRSFFNWFYFTICIGVFISKTFVAWIQNNVGWSLGFGIPALFMGIAITCFLFGTPFYRFQKPRGSPITRMCQVLVASCRKWNLEVPKDTTALFYETQENNSGMEGGCNKLEHTNSLRFLDKAAVMSGSEIGNSGNSLNLWRLCSVNQVEELKSLICLLPILATGIVFSVDVAQISTTMLEQGMTMDSTIGSLTIPPAALSTCSVVVILLVIPMYDRVLVPIVRRFTGNEKGFTELQRIGIGLFISVLSMSAAAAVEMYRLYLAKELGLADKKVIVPLSILWQIPQYVLVGTAEVFTSIGQIEFFYEESPSTMRSLCKALMLLTLSLGNYLSSFILTMVTYFSTRGGKVGWLPDNLNEGHLDYFFWFLAALSFLNWLVYMVFAMKFKHKKCAY
ncbi:protein NRT1/ PTR FAMILY 8.3-like [Humulus lupulus]|uniref:protein NRT1/ PTR FAMILY 8.3-like n=1 Tax=Humulus lupulus TaxID=3486 RepID=UPI002B40C912|nr:protein NRT1/ PTR FAMILY 8.3-like [Humulus lupulus]